MANQENLLLMQLEPSMLKLSNRLSDLEQKMGVMVTIQAVADKLEQINATMKTAASSLAESVLKLSVVTTNLDGITQKVNDDILPRMDAVISALTQIAQGNTTGGAALTSTPASPPANNPQGGLLNAFLTLSGATKEKSDFDKSEDIAGKVANGALILEKVIDKGVKWYGFYEKVTGKSKSDNSKKGQSPTGKCLCSCARTAGSGMANKLGGGLGDIFPLPGDTRKSRRKQNSAGGKAAAPNQIQLPMLSKLAQYPGQLLMASKATGSLMQSQRMLNSAMNANPMGRVIQLAMLLYENWDEIKAVLSSLWAKFEEAFPGIAGAVKTGIESVIGFCSALPASIAESLSGVYEAFTGAFQSAFGWLGEKFSWIKGAYNSLFSKDGGGDSGAGNVQRNARGGIITSPILTTFAEEGPEAAIPLDGTPRAVSLWYTAGRMLGMFDERQPGLAASLQTTINSGAHAPSLLTSLQQHNAQSSNERIAVSAPIHINISGNADNQTVQQLQQAVQGAVFDLKRQLENLHSEQRRVSYA